MSELVPLRPRIAEVEFAPPSFFVTVFSSFALLAIVATPLGHRLVGVDARVVLPFALAHAAGFAANVWIVRPSRYAAPSAWPLRLLTFSITMAVASAYGAAAKSAASPSWAVAIACAAFFGGRTRSALVAGVVAIVPPLLRAFLSEDGLPIAALVGGVDLIVFYGAAKAVERIEGRAERTAAESALIDDAVARVAEISAAMSLHDGLSGLLFATRQRLARETDPARAKQAAEVVTRRTESVLASVRRPLASPEGFTGALQAIARESGGRVSLSLEGDPRGALASLADVLAIAHELVANALRHGAAGPIALAVKLGDRIEVECRSPAREGCTLVAGRGLRNVRLRAQSHGGEATFAESGGEVRARVSWHPGDADLRPSVRAFALLVPLVIGIALAIVTRDLGALVPVVVAFVFVLMQARAELRSRAQLREASRRRAEAERASTLVEIDRALRSHLSKVSAAEEPGAIRAALDELASTLGGALRALEEPQEREGWT